MIAIVDVQGYQLTEFQEYIPKELSITIDGEIFEHFIFDPPCHLEELSESSKKLISWLEKYHFGIGFNEGYVPLHKISYILRKNLSNIKLVFVKGHQKYWFLKKYLPHDVSIIDLGYGFSQNIPKIIPTKSYCKYHNNNNNNDYICTVTNCKTLFNFLQNK